MVNRDTFTGPSFSWKNRVGRAIWEIVAFPAMRCSPRPFHAWRRLILRCFGAQVGKGVHVYPGAKIWAPWNLQIGDESGIASGAIIYSQGKITIGRRSVISQGSNICTGTHDYTRPGNPLITRPIAIGDEVWIAADVFVHPGVKIGDGCVIGARSVVGKDLPPWTVCTGHPCEPVKERKIVR